MSKKIFLAILFIPYFICAKTENDIQGIPIPMFFPEIENCTSVQFKVLNWECNSNFNGPTMDSLDIIKDGKFYSNLINSIELVSGHGEVAYCCKKWVVDKYRVAFLKINLEYGGSIMIVLSSCNFKRGYIDVGGYRFRINFNEKFSRRLESIYNKSKVDTEFRLLSE